MERILIFYILLPTLARLYSFVSEKDIACISKILKRPVVFSKSADVLIKVAQTLLKMSSYE